MNSLINRLFSEAAAPIGDMSMRLLKMAMLFFVALSCLVAGTVFLTIGAFEYLELLEGYTGAVMSIGGLYLAAALISIVVMLREKPDHAGQSPVAKTQDEKMPEEKEGRLSQRALFTSNIDKAVSPILGILQEAGMDRERLAIHAGAEIAKKTSPVTLVILALAAGFVLSRAYGGSQSRR